VVRILTPRTDITQQSDQDIQLLSLENRIRDTVHTSLLAAFEEAQAHGREFTTAQINAIEVDIAGRITDGEVFGDYDTTTSILTITTEGNDPTEFTLTEEAVVDSFFTHGTTFPAARPDDSVHFLYDFADPSVFPNGLYRFTTLNGWVQKSPIGTTGTGGGGTTTDTRLKATNFVVDQNIIDNAFVTLSEDPAEITSMMFFLRGDAWNQQGVDWTYDAPSRQVRFPTLVGSMVVGQTGTVFYVGAA